MRKLKEQKSILYSGGLLFIMGIIVLLIVNIVVTQTEGNVTLPPADSVGSQSDTITGNQSGATGSQYWTISGGQSGTITGCQSGITGSQYWTIGGSQSGIIPGCQSGTGTLPPEVGPASSPEVGPASSPEVGPAPPEVGPAPPEISPSPPPTTPSPPTSFDNITIQNGQFFDFNNGTKTNDVDKADIWWGLLNGQKYLVPKNDATYVIKGNVNFETENCNSENYSSDSSKKINSNQIPNGTVICFKISRISSISSVPTTIGAVVTEDIKFTKIQVNADDLDILRGLTSSGPSVQKVLAFLKLNSTPMKASIWIDGNDKGRVTPDTIYFEGEQIRSLHNYTLSLSGYRSYNETFNFLKGPKIDKEVTLIPTSSKSAPRASSRG